MSEPMNKRAINRGKLGGRTKVHPVRFSEAEHASIDTRSREAGLSFGSYLRACALGSPGPRARRTPPLNVELLAYAVAQLNRVGNNANQLMRRLHAADAVEANETRLALSEIRAAVRLICEALGR
jgi:hypothetical protein